MPRCTKSAMVSGFIEKYETAKDVKKIYALFRLLQYCVNQLVASQNPTSVNTNKFYKYVCRYNFKLFEHLADLSFEGGNSESLDTLRNIISIFSGYIILLKNASQKKHLLLCNPHIERLQTLSDRILDRLLVIKCALSDFKHVGEYRLWCVYGLNKDETMAVSLLCPTFGPGDLSRIDKPDLFPST